MYGRFFGLASLPFDLATDLRFLFMTAGHREALSNLHYGLSASKGLTVLIGEAGTGKTTIIRAFLASCAGDAERFIYLDNPRLTRAEFYELLASRMGLSPAAGGSKAQFLVEMGSVAARGRPGGGAVLIIDEAQAMPLELMEEVRLLTNLETEREKVVSIVLSGQQELADRLEEPAFRSLKQRVALRCELTPFDLEDTAGYIAGRIRIAGGNPARIFTRDAVIAIHEHARGIARTISVICDNALLSGFASDVRPVGIDIVADVCRDLKIERQRSAGRLGGPHAAAAVSGTDPGAAEKIAQAEAVRRPRLLSHLRRLVARHGRVTTLGTNLPTESDTEETIEN